MSFSEALAAALARFRALAIRLDPHRSRADLVS